MIAALLLAALAAQAAGNLWYLAHTHRVNAEERRFLINQALSNTPQEFAIMAAAARPDETVETLAEARGPRSSTPAPLGL